MPGFLDCVSGSWAKGSNKQCSSETIANKSNMLRYELKKWHLSLDRLQTLIQKCNEVILALDTSEEKRALFTEEFNFRVIVKAAL
jgi:hypothetical protein